MTKTYIGLGSNLGDARGHLAKALDALSGLDGVSIAGVSSVYLTEPWGMADQPFFHNQVACLECAQHISPHSLLESLLAVESAMGRVRDGVLRFGPRVIDLDILLFGDAVIHDARLCVPHPRMLERAFVLIPLAEIAPELVLPQGMSVASARDALMRTCAGDVRII